MHYNTMITLFSFLVHQNKNWWIEKGKRKQKTWLKPVRIKTTWLKPVRILTFEF
jgi:hypothetical protein